MIHSSFQFKQFSIVQQNSAMKVGTDGVLLGAMARGEQAEYVLDIGTGTGLIAIMLAQRFPAIIDAIEIDLDAANEAVENVENCPWNNRIKIIHTSFQDYINICMKKYSLIVSNPPYFKNSLKSIDLSKNKARHNDSLPIPSLFYGVNCLLSPEGIFQIIIPSEQTMEYIETALTYRLFCCEIVWIKPTPEKPPKRAILEFHRIQKKTKEATLVIEQDGRHKYSEAYKRLTNAFYLAF